MANNTTNKDDKNRFDENDPFGFFKLVGSEGDNDTRKSPNGKKNRTPIVGFLLTLLGILLVMNVLFVPRGESFIDYSQFRQYIQDGTIGYVEISDSTFTGYKEKPASSQTQNIWLLRQKDDSSLGVYRTSGVLMSSFVDLLNEKGVDYKFVQKSNGYVFQMLFNLCLPFLFLFALYFFIFKKMGGAAGGLSSIFGMGASKAKTVEENKIKTRFSDVAGVDEAKEELVEVVDFLKSPKKYTEIGGKIPKGVLLVGPPGTGKTLLARAVAGEAGVTFFRLSGSDFVEMFVGVGASRVRDLFRQAREKAPCIVFIDELDAIGKSRMNNLGGNDEREQTLNQLLVEMDGFDNEKGLIILAATNRPDVLDPALLRPGRFDRQVVVDKPDVKGREAILRIHSKQVKLDESVNFENLAKATSGFAGADLANIVNEAALLAVRAGRKKVSATDFDEAIEKTLVGLQKKTKVVKENEKRIVSYHETGHALVAAFTQDSDPVHKISIIPRGMGALGYTLQRPEEESFLKTKEQLTGEIDVLLGGRVAEQIIFGKITTGAANDIQRATDIARSMITTYGMSEKFFSMTLGKQGKGYDTGEPELVREYSENTQQYVDEQTAFCIKQRYEYVLNLLNGKKDLLEYIAAQLLKQETMTGEEFQSILDGANHCQKMMNEQEVGQAKEQKEEDL